MCDVRVGNYPVHPTTLGPLITAFLARYENGRVVVECKDVHFVRFSFKEEVREGASAEARAFIDGFKKGHVGREVSDASGD
jgi:hypothetical protein